MLLRVSMIFSTPAISNMITALHASATIIKEGEKVSIKLFGSLISSFALAIHY